MKKFSDFVTVVAAAATVLAAGTPPAGAADRPGGSTTRPADRQTGSTERLPQSNVHADYHIDARVGGAGRADRTDPSLREERRDEQRDRWTPGAERYTRPPQHWWR